MITCLTKNIYNIRSVKNIANIRHLNEVIYNRQKYLSPSLKTVEAFDSPFIIEKGSMQYSI